MIDSNNINVMREKLRKLSGATSEQAEIARIDNLIGASPIPGTQRTITSSLNYLYDRRNSDYSSDEIDTGVKWTDGKSIYKKTYSITSPTTINANEIVATDNTIGDIDELIELFGTVSNTTNTSFFNCNYYLDSNYHSVWLDKNDKCIYAKTNSENRINSKLRVTILYTKTE